MARSKAWRVPEPCSRTIQDARLRSSSVRARFLASGCDGRREHDQLVVAERRDVELRVGELAFDQPDVDLEVGDAAGDLLGVRDVEPDERIRVSRACSGP